MNLIITKNEYGDDFSRNDAVALSFTAELTVGAETNEAYYCTIGISDWSGNSQASGYTEYSEAENILEYSLFNKLGFTWVGNCQFQCILPHKMSSSQASTYLANLSQEYGWAIEIYLCRKLF